MRCDRGVQARGELLERPRDEFGVRLADGLLIDSLAGSSQQSSLVFELYLTVSTAVRDISRSLESVN